MGNSKNFYLGIIYAMLLMVVVTTIVMLLSGIVAMPLFGLSLEDIEYYLTHATENIALLKFFQVMQSLSLFVIPPLILAKWYWKKIPNVLLTKHAPSGRSFFLVLLLMFVSYPLIVGTSEWNQSLHLPDFLSGLEHWIRSKEIEMKELTEAFLTMNSVDDLLINLVVIALIPAIGEELLFRGVFQRCFIGMTRNIHIGIWLSAIVFSAFHMQFLGFIPRALLGGMFGYLVVWSGSLWPAIFAHFINNGSAVLITYLAKQGILSNNIVEGNMESSTSYLMILSLVFSFSVFSAYYRVQPAVKREELKRMLENKLPFIQ